jgi:hypothetical protein
MLVHQCPVYLSHSAKLLLFHFLQVRWSPSTPEGGRGDAVNLASKQLVDVSDLQYGLQKDDHVKPLCCCMVHYKHQANIDPLN